MMITADRPHRITGTGYGVAFWNGNTASNEAEATRAVVYVGHPGMPYPEFKFDLPAQRVEMEQLTRAFMKIFESGVYAGKKEVRDVLGITERR